MNPHFSVPSAHQFDLARVRSVRVDVNLAAGADRRSDIMYFTGFLTVLLFPGFTRTFLKGTLGYLFFSLSSSDDFIDMKENNRKDVRISSDNLVFIDVGF